MVKKSILIIAIFLFALSYLHQRVMVYVNVYQLHEMYDRYNKLVDERDVLLYNFSKEVSLAKLNSWVEENGYRQPAKTHVFAFNIQKGQTPPASQVANILLSSLNRFLHTPGISKAVAQERH